VLEIIFLLQESLKGIDRKYVLIFIEISLWMESYKDFKNGKE